MKRDAPDAVLNPGAHGALLDSPALRADPLADGIIARILGDQDAGVPDSRAIARINAQIARWQSNGDLTDWRAGADVPPAMAAALEDYVAAAGALPAWADRDKIARAERLFMDVSMMSCTLLFCASLPQCYVIPDLAAVLHLAGQLEKHTDYRVRSTAAMIFPVMMRGGLTTPDGGGVAQALKVRLIHATIRHLILRGSPAHAMVERRPLAPQTPAAHTMEGALYAHGWDVDRSGLPCNQEELAYTLLTFGYVFLNGLRRLGLGVASADEEAFLHAWNVVGHLLGIERHLMPATMDQAGAMFDDIQAHGRRRPHHPDARAALADALVQNLARYIPLRILKPFPVLLTRHLVGRLAAHDLGLDKHVSRPARAVFWLCLHGTRAFDAAVRLVVPGFSVARLVARVFGYRLTVKLLMDETRPLKLPPALLNQVAGVVRDWRSDPRAPRWMNALERRLTGRRDAGRNDSPQG